MRIVDWNIEHMNSWVVPNTDPNTPAIRGGFRGGGFGGGRIDDVPALAQRAASVLSSLDPDVNCIQESAGEEEAGLFLNRFLPIPNGGAWVVLGGAGGAQKLIVATRTDRDVTSAAIANSTGMTVQLDADYEANTDGDAVIETDTSFAREPLVVDLVAHGHNIRIINCHLKSKFVRDGENRY